MSDYEDSGNEDDDDIAGMLGVEVQRLGEEADAIMNSIRNESVGSPLPSSSQPYSTRARGDYDRDNSDYDDDEVDDEVNDEILKLGSVTANLRQDLDEISVESMSSYLSQQQYARGNEQVYRYPRKSVALQEAADFLRHKQLYGPGVGGQERNTPLLVFAVMVWSVILLLMMHVRYGSAVDAVTGTMTAFSIPQFLPFP